MASHRASLACQVCGSHLVYSERPRRPWVVGWEALFCRLCDAWRYDLCARPDCRACRTRPARPSFVDAEEVVVNRSQMA